MLNMTNDVFQPIPLEDIQNKVEINQRDWGHDYSKLKELLELEMFVIERSILHNKYLYVGKEITIEILIAKNLLHEIQVQNLKEQIAYVNNLILKELKNGNGIVPELDHSVHN